MRLDAFFRYRNKFYGMTSNSHKVSQLNFELTEEEATALGKFVHVGRDAYAFKKVMGESKIQVTKLRSLDTANTVA